MAGDRRADGGHVPIRVIAAVAPVLPESTMQTWSAKDRLARQPGRSAASLRVGTRTETGVRGVGRLAAAARDSSSLFPADGCMRG